MSIINNTTRIRLRIDSEDNWKKSIKPLLEGEVGISYKTEWDSVGKFYKKSNFKIKIGKTENDHNFLWNDSPDLCVSNISEEVKQQIIEQIQSQMGDLFVTRSEYEEFQEQVDDDFRAIEERLIAAETRLETRVKAYVENSILNISEDD